MKRIRRLLVLLVGVAISALASRPMTQAEEAPFEDTLWAELPSAPPPDPSCPTTATIEDLSLAEARLEASVDQLDQLDAQLQEVIGEPMPFGDDVDEQFTSEAVAETLAASDLEDVEIDCSEYPCLFFARVPEGDGCERRKLFPVSTYSRGSCGNGTVTSAVVDPDLPPSDNRLQHRLRMFKRVPKAQRTP